MCWCSYSLLLFLVFYVKGAWCLRLVSLHVPSRVIVGETIKLSCGFDLENDKLYSIKWYRDDVEFFRYVPRDKPPGQSFPLTGITVDLERSVNGDLYMRVSLVSTTGTYKCEVSADAPSFQTVSAQKRLVVRELGDTSKSSRVTSRHCLLITFGLLFAFLW